MTDQERFLALMAEFGVQPAVEPVPDGEGAVDCLLMAQEGKVEGYNGFYCEFRFGPAGEFRSAGVWE